MNDHDGYRVHVQSELVDYEHEERTHEEAWRYALAALRANPGATVTVTPLPRPDPEA